MGVDNEHPAPSVNIGFPHKSGAPQKGIITAENRERKLNAPQAGGPASYLRVLLEIFETTSQPSIVKIAAGHRANIPQPAQLHGTECNQADGFQFPPLTELQFKAVKLLRLLIRISQLFEARFGGKADSRRPRDEDQFSL